MTFIFSDTLIGRRRHGEPRYLLPTSSRGASVGLCYSWMSYPPSRFLSIGSLACPQIKTEIKTLKQTTAGLNSSVRFARKK